MAERLVKKLEERLSCDVCFNTYSDPRLLQCNHIYCRTCLAKLVMQDNQGLLIIICPACRQVTSVPETGVVGLKPALYIQNIIEALQDDTTTTGARETGSGHVSDHDDNDDDDQESEKKLSLPQPLHLEGARYCLAHTGKEAELYCETCEELICYKCAIRGGAHQLHEYQNINNAWERFTRDITSSLKPLETYLAEASMGLEKMEKHTEEVKVQGKEIEARIAETFQRLTEELETRKAELSSQLELVTQRKLESLSGQTEQVRLIQLQLSSCLNIMRESLGASNRGGVMKMRKPILEQTRQVLASTSENLSPLLLKPEEEANLMFSIMADVFEISQGLGCVYTLSMVSHSLPDSTIAGGVKEETLEVTTVGEKGYVILQARDHHNTTASCKDIFKRIKSELVSEILDTVVASGIKVGENGQCVISYIPTVKGKHQLHIKMNHHQHIRGSPFTVKARLPIKTLGTPIQVIEGVRAPWGITVNNKRGHVIVTSEEEPCVTVFSIRGERLVEFGKTGSKEGEFKQPRGVTVDGEGNILVIDKGNQRVQKFTADGCYITGVPGPRQGCVFKLSLEHPKGITYNATNNKIYIVDKSHITVLNSDLTKCGCFGSRGSGRKQFGDSYDLTCDSSGNMYVADGENHRIQVFAPSGKHLRTIGGNNGKALGELDWPVGVAVGNNATMAGAEEEEKKVYVSELWNHRVSVFDAKDGRHVTSFGRKGQGLGELERPFGVAVDDYGVVYVCDQVNRRICVF